MKIIIIGAGIAGLTLGLACEQAGIEYKIYDKAKSLRNIGGGILLLPHGLRYLAWMGLDHLLEPLLTVAKGVDVVGEDSESLFSEEYDNLNSLLGGATLPVDRSQLQQALAANIKQSALVLNKTCVAVSCANHQARVSFADGTEDVADLVIGADGCNSSVRKFINPSATLEYTQHCWWGGMIEQQYVPDLPTDRVYLAVAVGKICYVWPTLGNRFMWYLPVKLPLTDFDYSGDGRAQLHSLCADWTPEVQQIITAPQCAQSFHLPIYTLPPHNVLAKERALLIGDAAHALGPILGQGASMAIEDVFVLMNCLKLYPHDMNGLLEHYASMRFNRYRCMYALENASAAMMISENEAALDLFKQQIKEIDLATMYRELIGLIDEKACLTLAASIIVNSKAA